MSQFHCSCGFAIDQAEEFGDHTHQAFDRDDDIGMDGRVHLELNHSHAAMHVCACGFADNDRTEFDDHLMIVFITPDAIGTDGEKHIPADTSTPDRWYIRESQ